MKKKELIKKIAEEFNLDEIKVSEYFENIFETLAITFAKNKNVNISEFGKFKVKSKPDGEGLKQKTVLFSPVKKFADDINYNFNELSPVQIRVLGVKSLKSEVFEGEYIEEDVTEEIILIDFEGDEIPEIEKGRDVLIPEETHSEIPHLIEESKEEPEKEEEILIPDVTRHELSDEKIPDETKEEIKTDIIADVSPVITESTIKKDFIEEFESIVPESSRILEELSRLEFPELTHFNFEEKVELPEAVSMDKKVIYEVTAVIKQEEEIITEVPEIILDKAEVEEYAEDTAEIIDEGPVLDITKTVEEEKEEEEYAEEISEIIEEEPVLDITETVEEEKEEEDFIEGVSEVIEEEPVLDITETVEEEKKEEEYAEEISKIKEEEISDAPKTNIELETELLRMLDERKKILEEIKKLENIDLEDLIDITKTNSVTPDEKPNLFDEDILDKPKQNIFVDENGKILENLLKDFKSEDELLKQDEEIIKEPDKEEELIQQEEDEHKEDIFQDIDKELKSEDLKEDSGKREDIEEEKNIRDTDFNDLQNLFGSIYSEEEKFTIPESKEIEPQLNNPEMNVFDKLLDEPVKQEEVSETKKEDILDESNKDLSSLSDLEKMFVTFKTEKTEDVISDNGAKEIVPVEKTETIKTYDDIYNLIEPNGKKNGKESQEVKKEKPSKKFPPILKLIIPIFILIVLVFIVVYVYQRKVYKPYEETSQTQTFDSTKTSGSDSIIYADTNKTEAEIEEDVVYDEGGFVIIENEKGFYVQFGNFENQFELAKKIKELKEKNIIMEYEKTTIEGKETYKIKAGPYKSLREAKAVIPKL